MIEGPAGLDSPRWSCSYEDALGRTICETRPGFRGALLITSNEYNTANQLVATRSYALNENSTPTPLTYTYFCYNSLGQRTLTVSDMNLNGQVDWSDTDRIVSNDTRRAEVPVERKGKTVSFTVNTARDPNEATCFYEIVR